MARLRSLLASVVPRDAGLAVVLAGVLVIDSQLCPEGRELSALGLGAVGLCCGPLAWRTVSPTSVLVLVVLGVFACLFTLKPVNTVVLPPMVAAFTVALTGHRARSVLLGVAGISLAWLGVMAVSGRPRDAIYNASLMALAVVAGDALRSRREVRFAAARREAELEAQRERDAERRVADERVRMAREVHDVVAHAMVAINVQAGVAAHLLDDRSAQARAALTEIKRVSGTALGDLRSTLGLLRGEDGEAAPVRPVEVLARLPELAAPLRAAGVAVEVRVAPEAQAAPTAASTAAQRIVQEALTNVLRHSSAQRATVSVDVVDRRLCVDIVDDGAAMVAAGPRTQVPAGSGNGLRGMRERATALGGTVQAGPDPAGGWRVRAVLPMS